jgi:hypothetical protein
VADAAGPTARLSGNPIVWTAEILDRKGRPFANGIGLD